LDVDDSLKKEQTMTDGNDKLDDITAFTTSIRCKVIPDANAHTGMGYVIEIPAGSMVSGDNDPGGFRIALYEDEGRRFEKWMKEMKREQRDMGKMYVSLENDGYVRFSVTTQ
jgi:hypothetical protein